MDFRQLVLQDLVETHYHNISPDLTDLDTRYESTYSHSGHSWRNLWDTLLAVRTLQHILYLQRTVYMVFHVPGAVRQNRSAPIEGKVEDQGTLDIGPLGGMVRTDLALLVSQTMPREGNCS